MVSVECAALLHKAGLAVLCDDNKKLSSEKELQITTKRLEYALDLKSYDNI